MKENDTEETRAIFISYIELQNHLKGKDIKSSKRNIDQMINNVANFNFNTIILQVRTFSDAIYNSDIYPWSSTVSEKEGIYPGYDILKYFLEKAHKKGLKVHAWINPYRIRNDQDTSTITEQNPAYKWLNTNNVKVTDKGIYYNPASEDVKKLITDGIEELIQNYQVDGIFFDDYFYPSNDIDIENYKEYSKTHNISLNDYHLLMVNDLVKRVHKITKKNNILFGISPEGNIDNNYTTNFADVYTWGSNDNYVDYLMPQIYYGFYNESQPFYQVLLEWDNLVKNSNVKIIPALAFYKVDTVDLYAKSGINEWMQEDDIIMRQILISRNIKSYKGFSIFRYDSIFGNQEKSKTVSKEINNLKKIIVK